MTISFPKLSTATFVFGNGEARPITTANVDRFLSKVNKDGPAPDHRPELGPCWIWTAGLNKNGYGSFGLGKRKIQAHRFAYSAFVGPIPEELEVDHLCSERRCVNPVHLEPVSKLENLRRRRFSARVSNSPTCINGHIWTPESTFFSQQRPTTRVCRICRRSAQKRYESRLAGGDQAFVDQRVQRGSASQDLVRSMYAELGRRPSIREVTAALPTVGLVANQSVAVQARRRVETPPEERQRTPRSQKSLPTACPKGHPYDEANTYIWPHGQRWTCRTCEQAQRAQRTVKE